MTGTYENSTHSDINEEALLAHSQSSDTELDYEFSDSILESENNVTHAQSDICVKPRPVTSEPILLQELCPAASRIGQHTTQDAEYKTGDQSSLVIDDSDYVQTTRDVLDLQQMADKYAAALESSRFVYVKTTCEGGNFDYEMVTRVDKLIEETYSILSQYRDKLDREYRARLLNLLLSLKELPNLYQHKDRMQAKSSRVTEWLKKYTCHPEADLVGFTSNDPFEPRKFIPKFTPRVSSSDSNLVSGKRKRESDDTGSDVCLSSSDTRVNVGAGWSAMRMCKQRRAN